MFLIHSKREVEQELKARKMMQISAVMSAMTDEKTNKSEIIQEIEENYDEMIEALWSDKKTEENTEQQLKENPFFSAMKLVPEIVPPTPTDVERMYQQMESKPDIDQWSEL